MIDLNFFKPLLDGTRTTLKIQCKTDVTPLKPFMKSNTSPVTFDIASVIGLTSSKFSGSMSLCFPAAVYLKLMSNMLGEELTELTPELHDGAAELLNIIFGQAKRVLNDSGYDIEKAIPTVISGKGMSTRHISSQPVIVLPFETPAGIFHVEIVFGPGTTP